MFVLENYINTRKEKINAWLIARDKWVAADSYGYRSERDYERKYPFPVAKWDVIGRVFVICFLVLMLVGTVASTIYHSVQQSHTPQAVAAREAHKAEEARAESAIQSGDKCGEFKKNDHIRIQYGDYVGLTGSIVGGCRKSENYQIKLDPNQKADVSSDGNSDKVDVGGWTIAVDSSSNLVVVEQPKENK